MSEESRPGDRVRITVVAAAAHPDVLSVQDAMRQILDFFELLTPEGDENFVWNLKLATTNSPLTVEGEPYHSLPTVDARQVAASQKLAIEESFKALAQGRPLTRRLSPKRRDALKRIFRRNMNGIGRTEAVLIHADAPVTVTPSVAEISERALEIDEASDFDTLFLRNRARSEVGTIEGILVEVGSDYNCPAVLVRERNTSQEVWCRVSAEVRDRISSQTTLNDVWARRRVAIKGRIRYNSDGSFMRVWAHDLAFIASRNVELSEITDEEFTSGSSIADYLERLREG